MEPRSFRKHVHRGVSSATELNKYISSFMPSMAKSKRRTRARGGIIGIKNLFFFFQRSERIQLLRGHDRAGGAA